MGTPYAIKQNANGPMNFGDNNRRSQFPVREDSYVVRHRTKISSLEGPQINRSRTKFFRSTNLIHEK